MMISFTNDSKTIISNYPALLGWLCSCNNKIIFTLL